MSTNLSGWIEINTIVRSDVDQWFRVMELDVLVEQTYDVYGKLFGVRTRDGVEPVAAGRGLPPNTSQWMGGGLNPDHYLGITWASYEEIREPLAQLCHSRFMDGWFFVLECMEKLTRQFGPGNVRVVVGFDNGG